VVRCHRFLLTRPALRFSFVCSNSSFDDSFGGSTT
jgi:hypothetical protein